MTDPDRLDLSPCDADDPEQCDCHYRLPELIGEVERLRAGIMAALDCHTETARRITLQELLAELPPEREEAPARPEGQDGGS
jgi:hypothetical protein